MIKTFTCALLVFVGTMSAWCAPRAKAKAPDAEQLASEAEEALIMYDTERLGDIIDQWEGLVSKAKKGTPRPERLDELNRRLLAMTNMLQRVEKITVVDSISVDTAYFFRQYRLAADAGRIGANIDVGLPGPAAKNGALLTFFTPPRGNEVFFTDTDSTGNLTIMVSAILDDGTREAPHKAGTDVDAGSNSAYPFLMPDGVTLYFASDADTEASLGGYDIYRTRRDDNGNFLQATNMGMPYNSPANDYMLAIDETTGAGWWATDRNAEDGKVTIYVFRPNETRQNYDPDIADIADMAFLTDYRATQPDGFDAKEFLADIDSKASAASTHETSLMLSLGNGRVIRRLDEFTNPRARETARQMLDAQQLCNAYQMQLHRMRAQYAQGNTAIGGDIIRLEKELANRLTEMMQLQNHAIKQELQSH